MHQFTSTNSTAVVLYQTWYSALHFSLHYSSHSGCKTEVPELQPLSDGGIGSSEPLWAELIPLCSMSAPPARCRGALLTNTAPLLPICSGVNPLNPNIYSNQGKFSASVAVVGWFSVNNFLTKCETWPLSKLLAGEHLKTIKDPTQEPCIHTAWVVLDCTPYRWALCRNCVNIHIRWTWQWVTSHTVCSCNQRQICFFSMTFNGTEGWHFSPTDNSALSCNYISITRQKDCVYLSLPGKKIPWSSDSSFIILRAGTRDHTEDSFLNSFQFLSLEHYHTVAKMKTHSQSRSASPAWVKRALQHSLCHP